MMKTLFIPAFVVFGLVSAINPLSAHHSWPVSNDRLVTVKGKVIEFINMNEAFYGEATILGKPCLTGYEPMHDALNNVIGIYYFGYMVRGSLTGRYSADMN